jgi:hypothetical protein
MGRQTMTLIAVGRQARSVMAKVGSVIAAAFQLWPSMERIEALKL